MPEPKKPFKHTPPKGQNDFTKKQPINRLKRPGGGTAITVLHPTENDKKKKR